MIAIRVSAAAAALFAGAAALLAGAAVAAPGDTMSIVFSPAPIQGREFTASATGVSDDPASLVDATYKPAGGTCAATFQSDTGTPVDPDENSSATGTGQYTTQMSGPLFLGPGSYLFCGWMYDQGSLEVLATTQTVLNVPALHSSMQLHVPDAIPQGGGFTVSLDTTLDSGVPVTAWVDVLPNSSAGCARTPQGEPRSADNIIDQQIQDDAQPSGTVTVKSEDVAAQSNGNQLVCAWLLDAWTVNANPPPVVAGPVSAVVTIGHRLVFKGRTSQHFPISVGATPFAAEIQGAVFTERLHCDGTPRFFTGRPWSRIEKVSMSAFVFGVVRPSSSGRFTIKEHEAGRTTTVRGRITGKTVTGTLSDSGGSAVFTGNRTQHLHCSTGRVTFSARAK